MIVDRPEVHIVLRECGLHTTRDAWVRPITEHEAGWRECVAAGIRIASTADMWPLQIDPTTVAELVIALIKGASFNPKRAAELVQSFEQLLVQPYTRKTSLRGRS